MFDYSIGFDLTSLIYLLNVIVFGSCDAKYSFDIVII